MVEELTGIYIDHYISLDFNGFKDMVDAVDGVTVCIPEDVDDPEHGIYLRGRHPGAATASRRSTTSASARSSRANADIGRMKRQQAFVASMINKVISRRHAHQALPGLQLRRGGHDVRSPPTRSWRRCDKLAKLARQFRETDLDDIEFITVPFMEYEPDPNRLVWSDSAAGLWKVLLNDEPLPKKYREDVISAGHAAGCGSRSGPPRARDSRPVRRPAPRRRPRPTSTEPTERRQQEADANGLCA